MGEGKQKTQAIWINDSRSILDKDLLEPADAGGVVVASSQSLIQEEITLWMQKYLPPPPFRLKAIRGVTRLDFLKWREYFDVCIC